MILGQRRLDGQMLCRDRDVAAQTEDAARLDVGAGGTADRERQFLIVLDPVLQMEAAFEERLHVVHQRLLREFGKQRGTLVREAGKPTLHPLVLFPISVHGSKIVACRRPQPKRASLDRARGFVASMRATW